MENEYSAYVKKEKLKYRLRISCFIVFIGFCAVSFFHNFRPVIPIIHNINIQAIKNNEEYLIDRLIVVDTTIAGTLKQLEDYGDDCIPQRFYEDAKEKKKENKSLPFKNEEVQMEEVPVGYVITSYDTTIFINGEPIKIIR